MDKFDKFVEIIATLRGENGCPWDKKQTHDSLLQFLFEETNEVADTIVSKDYKHLQEELGDLLLQIVLHSQIAKENNEFAISDAVNKPKFCTAPLSPIVMVFSDSFSPKFIINFELLIVELLIDPNNNPMFSDFSLSEAPLNEISLLILIKNEQLVIYAPSNEFARRP